jgi:hypothetical protein
VARSRTDFYCNLKLHLDKKIGFKAFGNGGINNAGDYMKIGRTRPVGWLKNTSTWEINQDKGKLTNGRL